MQQKVVINSFEVVEVSVDYDSYVFFCILFCYYFLGIGDFFFFKESF